MTNLRKAAEMALLTLEGWNNHGEWVWPESALLQSKRNTVEAIDALRQALVQPEQEPIQAINAVIDYLYSTGADNDMANRAHIALKQLQMNLRDQTALHLLYKGDYEDLIAQPEQDKDNLNETNQALIELCEALNDALVEVCSANPKIEISRKHDQRIKNATAKIKEFT